MSRAHLSGALLFLVACGAPAPEEPVVISNTPATIAEATFAESLDIDIADYRLTESGLYWRDLKVGDGAEVQAGQTLSVHYDGYLPDGTLFESSRSGSPITFTVGVRQVIDGWDQGLLGMRVGGDRRLIIPPALGYGATGSAPAIPPNATLIFTVTVVDAQ
jgi:FKBP-type peptidyl-prolyl cis-trans isomerase FkpA